jgi:AdoMet-dependent rRNA methyltransferase SPB1
VVVCDGAPNVGGNWASEAYTQAALILEACRLATDFLAPKGLFLTKVFRSQEYHALLYAFHQLFESVESTKPLASRGTSAEIYVCCQRYRAPGKLDRRLLDPAHLFAPVEGAPGGALSITELGEAGEALGEDVLKGKDGDTKRHRGGYETATGVLYRPGDADAVFIASARPAE